MVYEKIDLDTIQNGHIYSSIKEEEVFIYWVYFAFSVVRLRILVMDEMSLEVWNSAWATFMQMNEMFLFLVTKVIFVFHKEQIQLDVTHRCF